MNHNFRELNIWKRSKDLCISIYKITQVFPKEEMFGLTSQIRRSSVSVPSNIAEGCGRNTQKQLVQFLNIAMGSLTELETQVIISDELSYIGSEKAKVILDEIDQIQKMLNVFKSSIIKQIN